MIWSLAWQFHIKTLSYLSFSYLQPFNDHMWNWIFLFSLVTLRPGLHEGLGLIWNWNRTILVVRILKLGPIGFTWRAGSKINEMTCLPTWHNLWHQKIGPKKKKTTYRIDNQFSPLGPKSLLIRCFFFPNNHNYRIKNGTLGDGVKWGAINFVLIFSLLPISCWLLPEKKKLMIFFNA